jgi:deoxycytidine triphosphate deaminase
MIGGFGNYRLGNLHGIFMFLKVKNFTLGYEKNDKINLHNAIQLLGKDYYLRSERVKKSGLYDPELTSKENFVNVQDVEINIKEMRLIAQLIGKKIYQGLEKLFSQTAYYQKTGGGPENRLETLMEDSDLDSET